MQEYEKLARELIEAHITYTIDYDKTKTRREVLEALLDDTEDVFGNMTGSRTCNTYDAQQFIDKSGAIWDDDIHELYNDIDTGYFEKTLARGAETFDVVTLELIAPAIINEMIEEL